MLIVRLQELWGRPAENVRLSLHAGIVEAYEVDGQERRIGDAVIRNGSLHCDLSPYSPRSFAVRVAPSSPARIAPPSCKTIALPYNEDVITADGDRTDGRMDNGGRSIPAEMLPRTITSEGIVFNLGATAAGQTNALGCTEQTIALPPGDYNRLYLLASATEGTTGRFLVDDKPHELTIQKWTGFVGQWDNRIWNREFGEADHRCDGQVIGIEPGFIKRDNIAWFCSHRHHPERGNEAYRYSYLFKYGIDLPTGANTVTLPKNEKIKVFAMTVARNRNDAIRPAAPLYDDFSGREPIEFRYVYPPTPSPIFEDAIATAEAIIDRQESFAALSMGAPVPNDFADQASGNGVHFSYFDGNGEYRPHSGSGAVSDLLPRLNDGEAARDDDDTRRCVWYDNAGRFFTDLGQSLKLARINTYSWHRSNRAPQYFSVWGSNDDVMPDPDIAKDTHEGWALLAVVNTKELGEGGVHGSSIGSKDGTIGPYRYLLWVVEDMGLGTFFTEIDIHAAD